MKTYTLEEINKMKPIIEDDKRIFVIKDNKRYEVKMNTQFELILKEEEEE